MSEQNNQIEKNMKTISELRDTVNLKKNEIEKLSAEKKEKIALIHHQSTTIEDHSETIDQHSKTIDHLNASNSSHKKEIE